MPHARRAEDGFGRQRRAGRGVGGGPKPRLRSVWCLPVLVAGLTIAAVVGFFPVGAGAESPHVITVADAQASEGEGILVFTVTRERATGRAISVAYRTADAEATAGADYEAKSGTVTLPPHERSVTVGVRLLDDALDEPNETFALHLTPVDGGVTTSRSSAIGTIADDDATGGGSGDWTVTDLGTPGPSTLYGVESSRARAITSDGRVAGSTGDPFYTAYGFVWHAGTVEATFYLSGTARSSPRVEDMNTHGQVVGARSRSGDSVSAFLWENGTLRSLDIPLDDPVFGSSVATGINDDGQVVGRAEGRAFLWENGTVVDLGGLGGGTSAAEDINGGGQIVGASQTVDGDWHAFLWQEGTMTDLGTLGGSSSSAMAINDLGQIVGVSETASGDRHAFLWEAGRMTDLGTLGTTSSSAYDINNGGQIVGTSVTAAGEGRAVIWDDGIIHELPDLDRPAEEGSYSPPSLAYGINDNGQVVGTSRRHAVLWSY